MATITIKNSKIQQNYSLYEIKLKFFNFLKDELKENVVNLYEISVDDLPQKAKNKLNKIDTLNFVDY